MSKEPQLEPITLASVLVCLTDISDTKSKAISILSSPTAALCRLAGYGIKIRTGEMTRGLTQDDKHLQNEPMFPNHSLGVIVFTATAV